MDLVFFYVREGFWWLEGFSLGKLISWVNWFSLVCLNFQSGEWLSWVILIFSLIWMTTWFPPGELVEMGEMISFWFPPSDPVSSRELIFFFLLIRWIPVSGFPPCWSGFLPGDLVNPCPPTSSLLIRWSPVSGFPPRWSGFLPVEQLPSCPSISFLSSLICFSGWYLLCELT